MKLKVYTDGGARGNPGPAAYGFVVLKNEDILFQNGAYLGETTNNVAEYTAVLKALEFLLQQSSIESIDFFLDSLLIQKQMTGEFKIKNESLKVIATQIKELEKNFPLVTYTHIPREKNKLADALVNKFLDQALGL